MSKEDSARGLLSKVVRFVRNPTVQWSDLNAPEEGKDSQYSKQVLKDMIERKRRNDFVRRREFDQLRKIRRRELVQGQKLEDAAGRTAFAQSSLASATPPNVASPDGRAHTLKKIDEIEAQMSQQWWRAKPGGPGGDQRVVQAPRNEAPPHTAEAPLEFAPTAPMTAPMTFPPTVPQDLMSEQLGGYVVSGGHLNVPMDVPTLGLDAIVPLEELEKFVHEPDLEEAAIRFANGDFAGAESGLTDVLSQHAQDDPRGQFDIWMTLFDLYRATGQQDGFDRLALDFAARFNRSAPLWFSLPEQLGLEIQDSAATTAQQREFSWNAPGVLTQQSLAALLASLARKPPAPWTLNWSRISDIEMPVVSALAELFQQWAEQPVELKFVGVPAFNALLQAKTPSGDREVDVQWWRLRMASLRLMGQLDEFELVALDYCVTYEVSPPSWSATKCSFQGDDREANAAAAEARAEAQREKELFSPAFAASRPMTVGDGSIVAVPSLSGYIDGDAVPLLETFEAMMRPNLPLQVNCERLIRMDFPAAGSVLNWAAEQQGRGQVVQFINLHRLIAVFFNVIGVAEHAWVIPRKN